MKNGDETESSLRILALHGSEGRADSLQTLLEGYLRHVNREITTIQAPFSKGSGYAWWQLKPGERSFTATTYPGYEESATLVTQTLHKNEFDVVFGHSQGAILLVAMLAEDRLASSSMRRFILNGVSWPNPFSEQLFSSVPPTSLDEDSKNLEFLQIIGAQDRINPPEQAVQVEEALKRRGCKTNQLHYPGGHSIPSDERIWNLVADWLACKSLSPVLFVEPESVS
jgi:predicted esterase